MTKEDDKNSTTKKVKSSNQKKAASAKKALTIEELSQKTFMSEAQVAAVYIRNGINLSKTLSLDEFKKIAE